MVLAALAHIATTSKTAREVGCARAAAMYSAGVTVSGDELVVADVERHDIPGEWNYTISPKLKALRQ